MVFVSGRGLTLDGEDLQGAANQFLMDVDFHVNGIVAWIEKGLSCDFASTGLVAFQGDLRERFQVFDYVWAAFEERVCHEIGKVMKEIFKPIDLIVDLEGKLSVLEDAQEYEAKRDTEQQLVAAITELLRILSINEDGFKIPKYDSLSARFQWRVPNIGMSDCFYFQLVPTLFCPPFSRAPAIVPPNTRRVVVPLSRDAHVKCKRGGCMSRAWVDRIGFVRFWAAAPALDIVALWRRHCGKDISAECAAKDETTDPTNDSGGTTDPSGQVEENEKDLSILLLGIGDVQHILFTAARLWKEKNRAYRVHFFVHEEAPEVLARHLLLLDIVNDTSMSLREGTRISQRKLSILPPVWCSFVCEERPHPLDALADLSHLKHRQRDEIQEVLAAWHPAVQFDLEALRDQRLRHCYGQRFDYKVNLMDWNYQMNLCPMTKRGQSVKVRGFWGDIVNGPFYAYGAETRQCYRDRLYRKIGDSQRYNSHDIMTFNITSILYNLQEQRFDCVIVANVATVPLFKHGGVLADASPSRKYRQTPGAAGTADATKQPVEDDTVSKERPATSPVSGRSPLEPSFLDNCLKADALVCFETFKYAANLNSVAKLRFRKVALEAARKYNWKLCNPSSGENRSPESRTEKDKKIGGNLCGERKPPGPRLHEFD
ncbi:GH22156, related [Neospora caninum Liverpool]|uniref:GH22156, related n=1 Tax=Neospora caninum (strain Liverpool) TaxID=572307 RepID=F0VJ63_NEOCL|nr:GH22156, related [Neospora caninum Liverpool]CBZ53774.1 GH22156, related [Neospora caninum Liverpool]|eukprot:XP_003883806.1 GH22156, related [Neospora caninum Liverpool]